MRRFGLFLALVAGAALLASAAFYYVVGVDRGDPAAPQKLVVPSGLSGRAIARLLEQNGIVRSALAFDALARMRKRQNAMRAGEFAFDAHRTQTEILDQLVSGGQEVAVWVTFPEGFTAKEIAQTLAERDLGDAATLESYFLDRTWSIDGQRTKNYEGFLFPDTYLIPTSPAPDEIAGILTERFRAALPRDAAVRAKRLHLTIPQVVTVASLVEREAKADDERALIAGVIYNRLRRRMPLQVDATLEYTFAHHKDVITYADLARDTPYNTYLHGGLPPTPIANPGAASLHAAFFPRASAYLYYVAMGNGHHAFSRTLAEHNANVARYLH